MFCVKRLKDPAKKHQISYSLIFVNLFIPLKHALGFLGYVLQHFLFCVYIIIVLRYSVTSKPSVLKLYLKDFRKQVFNFHFRLTSKNEYVSCNFSYGLYIQLHYI